MNFPFAPVADSISFRCWRRLAGVLGTPGVRLGHTAAGTITLLVVFFSNQGVQVCRATTGVVLYGNTFAVVAADGRVNEIGPEVMFRTNECKINLINGKVAVAAGLAKEQGVGFDVRKILDSALQQSGSVDEAADLAERQIVRALPAALRDFQKNNPHQFEARADSSLQILIVGLSGSGEVQIARRSIPYDQSHAVQRQNAAGSRDHVGVAAIGETGAIDRELNRLHATDSWAGKGDRTDLEDIARRLVAFEIVDRPRRVGPPVSMIVLDGDGVHWVDSGACQQHP